MGIIFFLLRGAQANRGLGGVHKRTPSIMFAHTNVCLWGTMMYRARPIVMTDRFSS